jgi:hypothetical protein
MASAVNRAFSPRTEKRSLRRWMVTSKPGFDLPDVLVKRAAQIGQQDVVDRRQRNFHWPAPGVQP